MRNDPYYYPFVDWKITESFSTPRVITNNMLVEDAEDWSRVRSPSRARRRMKQGHPQNVRIIQVPSRKVIHDRQRNVMYCHPELYRQVHAHLEAELNKVVSLVGRSPVFAVLPETVNPSAISALKDLTEAAEAAMRRAAGVFQWDTGNKVRTATEVVLGFERFSSFYNLDRAES